MRALAAEGHLMSEMENTVDRQIVIGRGKLLADCGMDEFIPCGSVRVVRVRTPGRMIWPRPSPPPAARRLAPATARWKYAA